MANREIIAEAMEALEKVQDQLTQAGVKECTLRDYLNNSCIRVAQIYAEELGDLLAELQLAGRAETRGNGG